MERKLILFDAFSDVNRQQQHFFGEDPSQYVDEVKQSLAGERGLSPRNRDLVMEVLGRLADRVQSAENSRNAVVNELVSLRERFVVRIAPNVTTYALSFYRSQNVLGWSKFFVPDQKFIYILWQSQTFCARQKDDLHSVKLFFVPAQKFLKRH